MNTPPPFAKHRNKHAAIYSWLTGTLLGWMGLAACRADSLHAIDYSGALLKANLAMFVLSTAVSAVYSLLEVGTLFEMRCYVVDFWATARKEWPWTVQEHERRLVLLHYWAVVATFAAMFSVVEWRNVGWVTGAFAVSGWAFGGMVLNKSITKNVRSSIHRRSLGCCALASICTTIDSWTGLARTASDGFG